MVSFASYIFISVIGFFFAKLNCFTMKDIKNISTLVVNIFIPALVIVSFNQIKSEPLTFLEITIFAFVSFFISILFSLTYAHFRKISQDKKSQIISSSVLTNCGYVGIPLSQVISDSITSHLMVIFTVIYTPVIAVVSSVLFSGSDKISLKNFLHDPFIISTGIGVATLFIPAANNSFVDIITYVFNLLAKCTSTMMLLVFGMYISVFKIKFNSHFTWELVTLRIVAGILSALALFAVSFILFSSYVHTNLILILAILPIGIVPYIYATQKNLHVVEFGSAIIISTALTIIFFLLLSLYIL